MSVTLDRKSKARKIDLRGSVPAHVQSKANEIFGKILKTASLYEASGEPARDVAGAAIYKHSVAMAGLAGSLHAAVEGGLSHDPAEQDRAAGEAQRIFELFKRDMADYLVQQVIELRAERAAHAPN